MTPTGRRTVLGAALAAGGVALVGPAARAVDPMPVNPLATTVQRRLDARALRVASTHTFSAAKAAARAAYLGGYHGPPPDEALERLDNAIDELALGMVMTATNDDPYRPGVHWLGAAEHRWFGLEVPGSRWAYDNPDTFYRTIPIDPESSYEVVGTLRGEGTADLAFSLVDDLVTQTTVAYVDGHRLRTRRDPSYRLTIGPGRARGRRNHLRTTPTAKQLFVRSTVADWSRQSPDRLEVRRTAGPRRRPPRTDDQIAEEAQQLILRGAPIFGQALLGLKTKGHAANTFSTPGATPGALVSQANAFAHFQLAHDEALVVTLDPAGARYVTAPVTDPWMVGVDPGAFQSSLNDQQAAVGADGRLTYVVSSTDPGVANWLDTAGRLEGTMMARWQRLGRGTPSVESAVVPLADLLDALPPDTAMVTPEERPSALAARSTAYARRFSDR